MGAAASGVDRHHHSVCECGEGGPRSPRCRRGPLDYRSLGNNRTTHAKELLVTTATTTKTTTYSIDKAHSEATFQVRHLLTKVRGRFSDFDGTIDYDEENPERSSVSVTVQAASIDTNERDRDTHLRSADFFDVEWFPT